MAIPLECCNHQLAAGCRFQTKGGTMKAFKKNIWETQAILSWFCGWEKSRPCAKQSATGPMMERHATVQRSTSKCRPALPALVTSYDSGSRGWSHPCHSFRGQSRPVKLRKLRCGEGCLWTGRAAERAAELCRGAPLDGFRTGESGSCYTGKKNSTGHSY